MGVSLREELARRMAHATHANPRYPGKKFDQDWELFLEVADECIRQMRWTAVEVAHEYRSSEGFHSREDAQRDESYRELTLAPEDWKP